GMATGASSAETGDGTAGGTGDVGGGPAVAGLAGRVDVVAAVRAAVRALSTAPAATVVLPAPLPPVVVTAGHLEAVAGPVLDAAADTVREVIAAAEVDAGRCAGVFCVGGGPMVAALARRLGAEPHLLTPPPPASTPLSAPPLPTAQTAPVEGSAASAATGSWKGPGKTFVADSGTGPAMDPAAGPGAGGTGGGSGGAAGGGG